MGLTDQELIQEAREYLRDADTALFETKQNWIDDMRFTFAGEQWDADTITQRKNEHRPMLTNNTLPTFVDQVVGDARQNRPTIRVAPVDSQGDPAIAQIYHGIIRNIEYQSMADVAYDTALENAVGGSFGFYRIVTEYTDDDVFDQDIRIKMIKNPLCVTWDYATEGVTSDDWRYCFISDWISRNEFKARFKNADPLSWEGNDTAWMDTYHDWATTKEIKIAEYFRKEPIDKTLYLLSSGEVVDKKPKGLPEGITVVRERKVKSHKIMHYMLNGAGPVEDPTEWKGKYIPVIPVWGKEVTIQGKRMLRSLIRFAKDAQRIDNYAVTSLVEAVALQPKAPYIVTPEQVRGFEQFWKTANNKNWPYLLYNPDPQAPGKPTREPPPGMSSGLQQLYQMADQNKKSTIGIHEAGLGQKSNETSGRAIMYRQREGDIATYAFIDNLIRAKVFETKVLIDLIPKIYDSDRVLRIRGPNGEALQAFINHSVYDAATGQTVIINDLTVGKYDVVAQTGPSFSTQRQETAAMMTQLAQAAPQIMALAGDIFFENQDFPGAQEIARRLKKTLPPGLLDEGNQPPGGPGQGGPTPQGPPPDPTIEHKVAQEAGKAQQQQTINAQEQVRQVQEEARLQGIALDNERKRLQIQRLQQQINAQQTTPTQ